MCHKAKKELKGTNALKYIEWGENQGFHKRLSCCGRQRWWECPDLEGNVFWGKEIRERIGVFVSSVPMCADCRLYFAKADDLVGVALNSTLTAFLSEVSARNLGGGGGPRSMMVYEVKNLLTFKPEYVSSKEKSLCSDFAKLSKREIKPLFVELGINPNFPFRTNTQSTPRPQGAG